MTSRCDIVFESDLFNLSQPRHYFINPSCYGDDVAKWLREKLTVQAVECTAAGQEDWGWYTYVKQDGHTYFVGIGGNAADDDSGDRGEWRFMVKKQRSFLEKLLWKNRLTRQEKIISTLKYVIESEQGQKFLRLE